MKNLKEENILDSNRSLKSQAVFQIIVIVLATIAFASILHENNRVLDLINSDEGGGQLLDELVGFFDLIPSVSAQETTPYSQGDSNSRDLVANCCLQTKEGAICQDAPSGGISSICDSENIIPASCDQVSSCQLGTCVDTTEGLCTPRSTRDKCELGGGQWDDDDEGNIPQCIRGCCVLGSEASYVSGSGMESHG